MPLTVSVSRTESLRIMFRRMIGVAKLNGSVVRSLREDAGATGQSLVVLAIVGLSFGLGFAVSLGLNSSEILLGGVIGVVSSTVVGFVWLSLSYLIGTRLFRGTISYWGLARPIFFSSSPGVIFLLTLIPVASVEVLARAVGLAWIALASVSAVKNAFGFDNQRGFLTFIIVAFIFLIGYGLVTSI